MKGTGWGVTKMYDVHALYQSLAKSQCFTTSSSLTILLYGSMGSICPVPANHFMVSAFILNFPGATPLDWKELDNQPRPPTGTVRVVRRPMGPLPPNPAIPVP